MNGADGINIRLENVEKKAESLERADQEQNQWDQHVDKHITVSPDIHVVTNANGDDDFNIVVIGSMRGQLTF